MAEAQGMKSKIGFIINPIAGMGGRVGLKGSDGIDILTRAMELGARPEAPRRSLEAMKILAEIKDQVEIFTWSGEMGEDQAREAGFQPSVVGSYGSRMSTPGDTIEAARKMAEMGVDLLLFAGGDGTARNICDAVGGRIPVLGIPAGVKIHSAVYAVNPQNAGKAAVKFIQNKAVKVVEKEVMDIDEEAFRNGDVRAKLYGFMKVPELKEYLQNVKSGGYSEKQSLGGIAEEIVSGMESGVLYIIGPGTTTRSIMDRLGLQNSLLGVDVVLNKQVAANDATENQLIRLMNGKKAKIVVTAIGGQGHIFGRGNQQISPNVIRSAGKENIIVVATKSKILSLTPAPLLVDTGDAELDRELHGYINIITGYQEYMPYRIGS